MKIDAARPRPHDPTSTEPARVFLQDRIQLWSFWVFVLSFGFYIANIVAWQFGGAAGSRAVDFILQTSAIDHLAASLVFGSVYMVAGRMSFSTRVLRAAEATALITGCTLFGLMGGYLIRLQASGVDTGVGAYSGLLACECTVIARAIMVPSTPRRTLALTILAMAPLLPITFFASRGDAMRVFDIAGWCAVSVALSTVGSHVIFGLRTEAARVRRLGQYSLEAKIGEGGMGVVYRASHAMLRRPTAIKLLPPDRAGTGSLARFEREVQITAGLSHPNTVAIYDYGRTPDGIFYYAMEYLDGINLEDLVKRHGPQAPGRAIAILDQVCGALSEAHERGLIHRDIKPANIILTERGGEPDVAKVVDFGLVRSFVSDDGGVTASGTNMLTGTPLYMAPEMVTAPDAGDARSDLYALGAVGYYLLTGRPVFDGTTVFEIIGHHLHTEPVPPSTRTGAPIPADLEAVVLKCLNKRPDERPDSARALREALRRCRMVRPWTADDAAAWSRDFHHTRAPAVRPDEASQMTVSVDIADRLSPVAV